jgi:hypothetical protein
LVGAVRSRAWMPVFSSTHTVTTWRRYSASSVGPAFSQYRLRCGFGSAVV